jgi:hypothetical protein
MRLRGFVTAFALILEVHRMKNARITVCLLSALLLNPACVPSANTRDSDLREQPSGETAANDTIQICVVEGRTLRLIRAVHRPETGDTLVDGISFSQRYPAHAPPYAQGAAWFERQSPIRLGGWLYEASTPARFIDAELLRPLNLHHLDTPLFAAADDPLPEIIYIPVRPGCIFQSYVGLRFGPTVDTPTDTSKIEK